jgi:hypothetical protein
VAAVRHRLRQLSDLRGAIGSCTTVHIAGHVNQSIERLQQASRRIENRILCVVGVLDAEVVVLRGSWRAA